MTVLVLKMIKILHRLKLQIRLSNYVVDVRPWRYLTNSESAGCLPNFKSEELQNDRNSSQSANL